MRTTYFPFYKTFRKMGLFLYSKYKSVLDFGTSERKTNGEKKDVSCTGFPGMGKAQGNCKLRFSTLGWGEKGNERHEEIHKTRCCVPGGGGIGIDRRAWGGTGSRTIRGSAT